MKRYVKSLINLGLCLIPLGFVITFVADWRNVTPISCVGSSGVKPFVEGLSQDFESKNKGVDITVEAGGSGFGISQVADGYADIGNASKNPFSVVKKSYQNNWQAKNIKTMTIGWEGICIVWIPPKGFTPLDDSDMNNLLYISNQAYPLPEINVNALDLLRIFSGFKQTNDDSAVPSGTLAEFINSSFKNNPQYDLLANQKITPYVRTGGALTSGTAASFYTGTRYEGLIENLTAQQLSAFATGQYGNDYDVKETDEANSRAWDMFNKDNLPGAMVYLSSGFVQQPDNMKLIQENHYGIMAYCPTLISPTTPSIVPFDIDNMDIKDMGYNWFRPLNMIFSLDDINVDIIHKFTEFIVNDNDELNKLGAKMLTIGEKQSMEVDGSYWFNDIITAKENSSWKSDWNWNDGTTFGAIADIDIT